MKKKNIAILGSTGSIGTQALDVIREHKDKFCPYVLTANNQVDLLIKQAREFLPDVVVITNEQKYNYLKEALSDLPIKVYAGQDAVCQVVTFKEIDIVLTAVVGFAGLLPTISAIKAGKIIALANKETLVISGELIQQLAIKYHAPIIPVDSEHSAIFQCITGEADNKISKILLTASGGPFRNYNLKELENVTCEQALNHPNWSMGAKITIDSATMINKGLEVIEAKWLFNINPTQIEVLVHPQSVIHSAVEFEDGCVKAQLGVPDMRLPILYSLSYPKRLKLSGKRLNLFEMKQLSFERPNLECFRGLALAFKSLNEGGNFPCALNAANEVANLAFRQNKISFLDISRVIEDAINMTTYNNTISLENYIETDREIREKTNEIITNKYTK